MLNKYRWCNYATHFHACSHAGCYQRPYPPTSRIIRCHSDSEQHISLESAPRNQSIERSGWCSSFPRMESQSSDCNTILRTLRLVNNVVSIRTVVASNWCHSVSLRRLLKKGPYSKAPSTANPPCSQSGSYQCFNLRTHK